jgi:hypothetical protein
MGAEDREVTRERYPVIGASNLLDFVDQTINKHTGLRYDSTDSRGNSWLLGPIVKIEYI